MKQIIMAVVDGKWTVPIEGKTLTARGAKLAILICYGEGGFGDVCHGNIIFRVTPRMVKKMVTDVFSLEE